MASLTGQTIASTYDALLKITDNGAITSSLKQITDGLGNNTPLFLSATTLYVNGNLRAGGALYDGNNEPGTNGQFLVSTGTGVDWQNIAESGLITGSGTNGFISKFTASGVIANSVIQENSSNIGIGISPTQKLHVSGNGLFTGTLTASNVSGSNTGDETKGSIESKLGAATSSNSGYLTSTDWSAFDAKQDDIILTTTGNNGSSTFIGSTLNIPTYSLAGLGGQAQLNGTGFVKVTGTTVSYDNASYTPTSTAINTTAPLSGGGNLASSRTLSIVKSDSITDGYLSKEDWSTFNSKQSSISLTTTGDSGASSLIGVTLNIPTYTLSGLGGVPSTRTISINGETFDLSANRTYSVNVGVTSFNTRTGAVVLGSGDVTTALGYTPALNSRIMTINGVGYDLSADRTWSVGTVTSVGTSAPLTGGTITSTGTIGISQSGASADGYLSSTDWNTFNNKQAALGFTPENSANKGANNGYASLDGAGKVPSGQLPSYVDDVVEVANYAALPATGETGKIYITLDTNFVYRWSGSVYVKISEPNAVWGSITGTLSNQTDLQSALNAKVDNTRTITINGTASDLSANRTFNVGTVTSVSGAGSVSGLSLSGSVTSSGSLTLGGTLALTSGDVTTGLGYTPVTNARTLSINGTVLDLTANRSWSVGTVTSVGLDLGTAGTDLSIANSPVTSSGNITLNIPTASAANRGALSSTDWSTFNNKQNTLTLTTTGSSGASTLVGATLNIPTYTLSGLGGQPLLTNPVTGTGTSGYLTRFTGSTSVGNSVIFDNGSQVGIGTNSPGSPLDVFLNTGTGYQLVSRLLAGTNVNGNAGGIALGTTQTFAGYIYGQQTASTGGDLVIGTQYIGAYNERMRITSAGNVGIGTTDPQSPLEVTRSSTGTVATFGIKGQTINPRLRIDADESNNTVTLNPNYSGSTSPALVFKTQEAERMRILASGNVGINTTSPTERLHIVGNGLFSGSLTAGGDISTPTRVAVDTINGYTGASTPITIQTGGAQAIVLGTSATERMRITSAGNVGIGTTSPAVPLDVVSNSTANGINLRTRVNDDYGFLNFKSYNASETLSEIYVHRTAANVASLIFTTNNGTSPAEHMRITSAGNVGIGISSPTDGKLQVAGSSQLANTIAQTYFGVGAAATKVTSNGSYAIGVDAADGSTERMRITSGGNVLIGTTANGLDTARMYVIGSVSQTSLEVGCNGVTGTLVRFSNSQDLGGSITIGGGGTTAYNTSSDYRLKEDLKETNGLEKLSKLKVYDFKWKDSEDRMDGVLAHELQEVIPYAVVGEKDGENMQGVDYSKIVPILVKAIQELKAELDELKNNK